MNTHDIELPPMSFVLSGFCKDTQDSIRDYARAAIKADRKRRVAPKPSIDQDWAALDPATAFHLIERYAENWDDAGAMMQAYADAQMDAYRKRRGGPVVMREICPECGHQFECFHNGYINELRAAHVAPQPAEPPFCEECGDGIMAHDPGICGTCYSTKYAPSCDMDEHACNDPSQCWEPCGELGKSIEHAKAAEPVEVPSGDELLLSIINYADARATITENRLEGADRETDRIAHDECAQAYADMVALLARYGQNPTIPAGWKLVPVEPSYEMIQALWSAITDNHDTTDGGYKAMLAAAPEPPRSRHARPD